MEVRIELEQTRIVVTLSASEEERNSHYGEKMAESLEFSIASNGSIDLRKVHDDHLALIVLLAAHPFAVGNFCPACRNLDKQLITIGTRLEQ